MVRSLATEMLKSSARVFSQYSCLEDIPRTDFRIICATIPLPTAHINIALGYNTSYNVPQRWICRKFVQVLSVFLIFSTLVLSLFTMASEDSLCCSLVVKFRSLSSCMLLLYSNVMGVDMVHNARIFSVIPLPWVKPSLLFNEHISVCPMTKSELRPAQYWLL